MRVGGGKGKGSAFERKTCKELSMWITKGERQDLFWRSAMSGGRARLMINKGEDALTGDISAIHPLGHRMMATFSIECKHYKEVRLRDFVLRNKTGLPELWRQAATDADDSSTLPMLIAKQNNTPTYLFLPRKAAYQITKFTDNVVRGAFNLGDNQGFVYVCLFDDFLERVDAEGFLNAIDINQ